MRADPAGVIFPTGWEFCIKNSLFFNQKREIILINW
jgi:hypothetical protein